MITYTPTEELTIREAISKGIELARKHDTLVDAVINGEHIYVSKNNKVDMTVEYYRLKKIYKNKQIQERTR